MLSVSTLTNLHSARECILCVCVSLIINNVYVLNTRVVPKVMSNFFLHANWEQQTKESAVVVVLSLSVL